MGQLYAILRRPSKRAVWCEAPEISAAGAKRSACLQALGGGASNLFDTSLLMEAPEISAAGATTAVIFRLAG